MLVIVASDNTFFGGRLSQIVKDEAFRQIRSADVERVLKEMKKPERTLVLDMTWEDVQRASVLRQIINVGRIVGNKVLCICPNEDEKLKKMCKMARADEVFIRYDVEGTFKEYMRTLVPKKNYS